MIFGLVLDVIERPNLFEIPRWELNIHYTITIIIAIIYLYWAYRTYKKLRSNMAKVEGTHKE